MRVALFSNFLNHHQLPLCKAFLEIPGVTFKFVATTPVPEERLNMGYHDMNTSYDFVVRTYENYEQNEEAINIANTYDVVICGNAPLSFLSQRIADNKLSFRYSERIFKSGYIRLFSPKWFKKKCLQHIRLRHKNVYMLCASAYTAADMSLIHSYKNRLLKWGYFPEIKIYDNIHDLIEQKNKVEILWASRLIPFKHPEIALSLANYLKNSGIDFHLSIIGNGELWDSLQEKLISSGLESRVSLLGAMSPENVREHMEHASVFIFTSDRNEGWGAVLNESMNSGCAVVASDAIGAVPFLINDGVNGMIYHDGKTIELCKKVEWLLSHEEERNEMGKMAYLTLTESWNAKIAAERLIKLSSELLEGNDNIDIFPEGICSIAPTHII